MRIGVFDSGKGGEFVANELIKIRQNDEFIIEDDSENVPYGGKDPEEIIKLTDAKIRELIDAKCETIIIACNTATVYAISYLRKKYPKIKFIGFEPMIKPASKQTKTGKICILATPATLNSDKYLSLKKEFAQNLEVFEPDCSDWAKKIELQEFTDQDFSKLDKTMVENDIDQIVLACTHYILLEDEIKARYKNVEVLQPILAVNKQIPC